MIINEEARYVSQRVVFLESTVVQLCKRVSQMELMMSTGVSMLLSPDTDDEPAMEEDSGFESTSNLDLMDDDEPQDGYHESTRQHSITPQPVQEESNDPETSEISSTKAPSEQALPDNLDTSDKKLQFSMPAFTDIPPCTVPANKSSLMASKKLENFLKLRVKHFMGENAPVCVAFQKNGCCSARCEGVHHCLYCLHTLSVHGFAECPRKENALKEFHFHAKLLELNALADPRSASGSPASSNGSSVTRTSDHTHHTLHENGAPETTQQCLNCCMNGLYCDGVSMSACSLCVRRRIECRYGLECGGSIVDGCNNTQVPHLEDGEVDQAEHDCRHHESPCLLPCEDGQESGKFPTPYPALRDAYDLRFPSRSPTTRINYKQQCKTNIQQSRMRRQRVLRKVQNSKGVVLASMEASRWSRACDHCHFGHTKCDMRHPSCSRCERLNAICRYPTAQNYDSDSEIMMRTDSEQSQNPLIPDALSREETLPVCPYGSDCPSLATGCGKAHVCMICGPNSANGHADIWECPYRSRESIVNCTHWNLGICAESFECIFLHHCLACDSADHTVSVCPRLLRN
ncbi:hypothetical protein BJ741DRAFT_650389 [Chytriomyces cf. hyalinus JEL632]|nr:hypothetical protein BJ741DRAFT_650389 [Chytriomyces cf. hyalinus JEL632]